MLKKLFENAREWLGSSASWRGQFGFRIIDSYGVDRTRHLGGTMEEGFAWGRNRVVNQGLAHLLNAGLRGEGTISNFYIAPFSANVAPAPNLTAADFASVQNEFTNYTETNRVPWVTDGAATSTSVVLTNAASPALFTIGGGAGNVIWGAGLLSAQGKGSTSGVLVAAQRRGAALNVEEEFEIRIRYRITGSSS